MFNKIKKIFGWSIKQRPDITLHSEIYDQLKGLKYPFIVIQIFLLVGTLGYLALEDYDVIQAFFQTSYTFTNTGFGALNEDKFQTAAIIFTSFMMFCGSAVVAFSLAFILSIVNRGILTKLLKEQKMIYRIARLRNHYVICYHNEYTIELSKAFKDAQIPFVVVDNSEDFEEEASKCGYPYFIKADPHTKDAFLKTHLSSAKGLVSFSKNQIENIALLVSVRLYEKELQRSPYYIISSTNSVEESSKLKALGCDSVVSAPKLMAQRISSMAIRPDMENLLEQFLYKKDTKLDLEEFVLPKYSWLNMKKLKEAHLRDATNVSVVSITHKDGKQISMPTGDALVSSECKILMIGTSSGIKLAKSLLMKRQKPQEVDYV